MLEKAFYTYKYSVIQQFGQPIHLPVICSVPSIPLITIIKESCQKPTFFITFCTLSSAKGMDISMKKIYFSVITAGIIYAITGWILYFEILEYYFIISVFRLFRVISLIIILIIPLLLIRTIVTEKRYIYYLKRSLTLIIIYFGVFAFTSYCNSYTYNGLLEATVTHKFVDQGYYLMLDYPINMPQLKKGCIIMRCPKQTYELLYPGVTLIGARYLDNGNGKAVLKDFSGVRYEEKNH